MAHNLEMFADGTASMAWVGQTPWHGLGVKVDDNLTPLEMAQAASVDWSLDKVAVTANVNGKEIETNHFALIRNTDQRVIDVVPGDWEPLQNVSAFEFFDEFVRSGDMHMHTAGSLRNGEIVWALAKVNESFYVGREKEDVIHSHLLFTNFHTYGRSIDVRFTPIRVVCNNTLTMAMASQAKNRVSVSHRRQFSEEDVKARLGLAHNLLSNYKEQADFLASRNYNKDNLVEYFQRVFPKITTKTEETANDNTKLSKSAKRALEAVENQPGAAFSEGSWWQAFNATTFLMDHVIGRNTDSRLASAWYGQNQSRKMMAMKTAIEYAEAA